MNISLKSVLPEPIKELDYSKSEIWNKEIEFVSDKSYLIKAPSGTGKTTFVSLLYGIRKDFSGDVFLDGKAIKSIRIDEFRQIRQTKFSFVFQGLKLFPELTGYENIEIKNGLTKHLTKDKIYEFAERLGVLSLMERKAEILSFGQQQRIAIIRALCQPFEFLLLDEPFSHLDATNTELCLELIESQCKSQKAGFILTTLGSTYNFNYDHQIGL